MPSLNGIRLPELLLNPIPAVLLDFACLIGWDRVKIKISEVVSGKKLTREDQSVMEWPNKDQAPA